METTKIGIREFRERLASFMVADKPLAITRHGDTVGYYIPTRRKASERELLSLREASARIQKMLAAKGITEDEMVEDFKRWRAAHKKRP